MRRWLRTTVVNVDSAIDPPIAPVAGNNGNYTEERQQDLGYEPVKSTGAPVYRYWSEPAVSDPKNALFERQCPLSHQFLVESDSPKILTSGGIDGSTRCVPNQEPTPTSNELPIQVFLRSQSLLSTYAVPARIGQALTGLCDFRIQ